ncbi:MAG: phospho-sugar mutase [Clostridia bacterium]|nr:phospho-sugar mutase [Clostridia bacterium]
MKELERYSIWLKNATGDRDLIEDLKNIADNKYEIYDRFHTDLTFGTAGLRGVLAAGSNRMNIYTVRRASKGLADYLNSHYNNPCVAISFDSRIKSDIFAKEAAKVLAANDIKVYIVKELSPLPFLSFVVRFLKTQAGIMITASHNPAQYNGYKCFGEDGSQLAGLAAAEVYSFMGKNDIFDIKTEDFDKAVSEKKIAYIEDAVKEEYLKAVYQQSINKDACKRANLKVVYTPLNGAGNKFVRSILQRVGIQNVSVVKEQELPDGNFPTCRYPNPEVKEALELAIIKAKKENADIVIATDPDSDRIGIAVKKDEDYRFMTGNEVGIMLLEYILSQKKLKNTLPSRPFAVKTIVSTDLADKIAMNYGCELREVLTGFKYIGEQILNLEKKNEEDRFVFGFEESYGYLPGTYVRDKDAVVTAMLICEMASFFKLQGKTLVDFLNDLYLKYGFYKNTLLNFNFEGLGVFDKMENVMKNLRDKPLKEIAGYKVLKLADYSLSKEINLETKKEKNLSLPKSNVISYYLENGNKVIIRPSGTEPKIKVYITAVGANMDEAQKITEKISAEISGTIKI